MFHLWACIYASLIISITEAAHQQRYEVKEKREGYEVRLYPAHKSVAAREKNKTMNLAYDLNLQKISAYFQDNRIPTTVPVTYSLLKDQQGNYVKDWTMSLWLPEDFQHHPPEPTTGRVWIEETEDRIFYVRRYGLWAIESAIKENEKELVSSLKRDGRDNYNSNIVYSATYNPKFWLWNRRNEVMFAAV